MWIFLSFLTNFGSLSGPQHNCKLISTAKYDEKYHVDHMGDHRNPISNKQLDKQT